MAKPRAAAEPMRALKDIGSWPSGNFTCGSASFLRHAGSGISDQPFAIVPSSERTAARHQAAQSRAGNRAHRLFCAVAPRRLCNRLHRAECRLRQSDLAAEGRQLAQPAVSLRYRTNIAPMKKSRAAFLRTNSTSSSSSRATNCSIAPRSKNCASLRSTFN